MRIIKIKFKCSICRHEYEHKVNPDSRGFFIVPKIHCSKCLIEMDAIIDNHKKQLNGEEKEEKIEKEEIDGLDKSISE